MMGDKDMWSKDSLDALRIIHGDQLELVGDIVVIGDADKRTCKLIRSDGSMLVDEEVYGVAYELGRGGFHYVVLTSEKDIKDAKEPVRSQFITSAYFQVRPITSTFSKGREYVYKIFNSEFSCERVGRVKAFGSFGYNRVRIEVGGKIVEYYLKGYSMLKDPL